MTSNVIYQIGFFTGNTFIITLKKPTTTNLRSFTRDGVELIMSMSGTIYHYYVAGIPTPVPKKYMTASIVVNELVKQFRQAFPAREESKEIWMFYENKQTGDAVPVRYFILSEHEVKIR